MPGHLLTRRLPASDHLPRHVSSADRTAPAAQRAWTEEQARAIERRRGDLLLDAAAGSGKTSVLVERFARAVLHDAVPVGSILVITFTEKAAAELRERIRLRLRELGALAAAREAERAPVSTIHGFCARLLRAHALEAGLDPRFAVLDADAAATLQTGAFDAALSGDEAAADLVELIAAYGLEGLRSAILGAHEELRAGGALSPALPALTAPGGHAVRDALHAAALGLAAELAPQTSRRAAQTLERVERAMALGDPSGIWPGELRGLAPPGGERSPACEAYAEALEAFRAAAAAWAAVPVRDGLARLLGGYAAAYAAAKRELSAVDFTDLELLAGELLATRPALRAAHRERYAAVMVDEMQDTNPVQLALVESICQENLFTVGDAQQSIYGFRHADVELFRERGRRLQARGERETLRVNFRTRPEIVEVLNPLFEAAMGEQYTPLVPGRPPAGDGAAHVELLVVDKGADWDLEGTASPWRLAEAAALAARVGELVAGGVRPGEIVLLIRAGTDLRAYEAALEREGLPTYVIGGRGYWEHPQVLDMVAYLRALANPRDEEPLLGVLASPLVGLSLDGLVALVAAARRAGTHPWALLQDPDRRGEAELGEGDAARLAGFGEWFAGERAAVPRIGIEALIDRALLHTGYDLTMLQMPGGVRRLANVRKLMRLGREHEAEHGPDLRGFLARLADRAAGRAPEDRQGEAPVEGEGLDAIRLMTIHRAKGLEFPVVCVADLGRSPRPPASFLRVGRDGRLGLRLARPGDGEREDALDFVALRGEATEAEAQEERRLFYVAMTRARERLLLSGAAGLQRWADGDLRAAGPIGWIAPALVAELPALAAGAGGEIRRGEGRVAVRFVRPGEVGAGSASPAAAAPQPPPDPAAIASPAPALPDPPAVAGGPATLSYSALSNYRRCGYRFYVERVLGLPAGAAPADGEGGTRDGAAPGGRPAGADGEAGRRRGILAHALLERLDFRRPLPPSDAHARAAARRAGLRAPGPQERDRLTALVRAFAASGTCARLARAREVRREQRFAFPLALDDPGAPLVVGALDVLAREDRSGAGAGDVRLVVDYKTDRLAGRRPAAVVADGYADQQLVYAIAALHAGAGEVEVCHVFLEAPEDPVSIRHSATELPALRARLAGLAGPLRRDEYPVAPDPHRGLCAGCPAEAGLCTWPPELTRRARADTLF